MLCAPNFGRRYTEYQRGITSSAVGCHIISKKMRLRVDWDKDEIIIIALCSLLCYRPIGLDATSDTQRKQTCTLTRVLYGPLKHRDRYYIELEGKRYWRHWEARSSTKIYKASLVLCAIASIEIDWLAISLDTGNQQTSRRTCSTGSRCLFSINHRYQ